MNDVEPHRQGLMSQQLQTEQSEEELLGRIFACADKMDAIIARAMEGRS